MKRLLDVPVSHSLHLRVTPQQKAHLEALARERATDVSSLLREAIDELLEEHGDGTASVDGW